MNHFVPCQSYLAVKEPFECAEQQALVGHSTFLNTTHIFFFQAKKHCCLLFWTMSANVRTTPCAKGFNGLLNAIYLELSINAQLVLEPFQFVIVQLQLSDSFQMA